MSKYTVICADPPYGFRDSLSMSDVKRGALANYSTMSIKDIKSLPVKDLTDPEGSVLALWVPSSLLQDGLDIMKAWGFTHKQTYVWVKTKKQPLDQIINTTINLVRASSGAISNKNRFKKAVSDILKEAKEISMLAFGMGRLFRQTHELCLIGINNNKIYQKLNNKSQRSVSFASNLKHSAKPEDLQNSLEIMFPNTKKIELFARRDRIGWTCIGNESLTTYGEDIRDSLNKLINNL